MYNRKDHYFRKAKEEGYRARSAFKLSSLNKRYNIIKKNDYILDIGCSPGSWSQIAQKITGKGGLILGIDIVPMKELNNVKFIQGSISEDSTIEKIKNISNEFDVIISDIAPKTTGIKELDHNRSIDLNEKILETTNKLLKVNGNLICKVFQGEYFQEFLKKINKKFEFVKSHKPEESRKESKEIYIIAKGFKKLNDS